MSNRRKIPQPAAACGPISSRAAVRHIADCLADRTSYVVGVPPNMIETVAIRAARLPARWLLDNGTRTVMQASGTAARVLASLLGDLAAAVVTIPKTTPAAQIRGALGELIPADGSQDVIIVGADGDSVNMWPRLLTAAIAEVDPAFAAVLAASDLANLS